VGTTGPAVGLGVAVARGGVAFGRNAWPPCVADADACGVLLGAAALSWVSACTRFACPSISSRDKIKAAKKVVRNKVPILRL
jgi:hypothetical protein